MVKRRLEKGIETVESTFPLLITVMGTAPICRPRNAKLIMKYKHATTISERQNVSEDYIFMYDDRPFLNLPEWNVGDIEAEPERLGLSGSPTKVKKVENVVFQAKEAKVLEADNQNIEWLMKELISNHTLG